MENIFQRVSVRSYEDKPVEEEKIDRILRAGFAAPSSKNKQPWEFVVVTNKEKLVELSTVSLYSGCLKNAPAAIVPVYRLGIIDSEVYTQINMAIATENMWLAMPKLELGGVWLGVAPVKERMDKVSEVLDLPSEFKAFAMLAFGYPKSVKPQQDRYQPDKIHWIR